MNPSVFDLLESYYRPKRQLRAVFWVGGLVLFVLLMGWAASMWIFGVDEVPRYVCTPGARDFAECAARYKGRANEFAEARALASLVPLAIGALAFASWLPIRNQSSPPLVRLIRERPMEAVWIYALEIRTKKRGEVRWREHRVVVGTVQRKTLHMDVREDALQYTMAAFSAALPHATVGFNEQLEGQFRANPESLRRAVPQMPGGYAQQPYPQQPYPQQPMPAPLQPPYPQQAPGGSLKRS